MSPRPCTGSRNRDVVRRHGGVYVVRRAGGVRLHLRLGGSCRVARRYVVHVDFYFISPLRSPRGRPGLPAPSLPYSPLFFPPVPPLAAYPRPPPPPLLVLPSVLRILRSLSPFLSPLLALPPTSPPTPLPPYLSTPPFALFVLSREELLS
ncbi:hypothetical protein DFH09DRAFT_1311567 [Mycena vulgaris]|nr:hypothetical protein DFH09DRAFT_1311567 [Mycena vulgaris]